MAVHPIGKPFRATLIKEERMVGFPFDKRDNGYGDIAEYGDFFAREHPPRASLGQFHELLVILCFLVRETGRGFDVLATTDGKDVEFVIGEDAGSVVAEGEDETFVEAVDDVIVG